MAFVFAKRLTLITILSFIIRPQIIHGQQVPCAFFFGDSQFDNGNNNVLVTLAKVNYAPYGIDYPGGATGRFTNGQNTADFIAQFLGFPKPIPPFVTTTGSAILQGVNYASGGGGILDETGRNQFGRFTMNQQLQNHRLTISRITRLLGGSSTSADNYLQRCLYTTYMGSNDYLNNYLLPEFYLTSTRYTPDSFADILIQKYSRQLTTLYYYGARKVAVFSVGLLGCIPQQLARNPTNGSPCVDSTNAIVQLFNDRLIPLVKNLNSNLPGAQYTFINLTSISSGDPSSIGIRVVNAPCCRVAPVTGLCIPNLAPCSNRSEYAFFDNFHTTSLLNAGTALRAYSAESPTDAYPVDIRRLVQP